MIIFYAFFVATFIVGGQALWKLAVMNATKQDVSLVTIHGAFKVLTSWQLLLGVLVYGVATVAYILLLSKYKYFQIQSLVVGSSLIFTLLLSSFAFNEPASLVNVVGVVLIVSGALLIIR